MQSNFLFYLYLVLIFIKYRLNVERLSEFEKSFMFDYICVYVMGSEERQEDSQILNISVILPHMFL